MLFLHPELTLIQKCHYSTSSNSFVLEDNAFYSYSNKQHFTVRYLNRINSATISRIDMCMKCLVTGPDTVLEHSSLSSDAKKAIKIVKATTSKIYSIDQTKMPIEVGLPLPMDTTRHSSFLQLNRGSAKKRRKKLKTFR